MKQKTHKHVRWKNTRVEKNSRQIFFTEKKNKKRKKEEMVKILKENGF